MKSIDPMSAEWTQDEEQGAEPFADFEALRAEIARRQPALPKRLGQIASYALDNPDHITFGTVASVSAASRVAPATIVRFAQSFGFGGFNGLQRLFQQRLIARGNDYLARMAQGFHDRAREQGLPRLPSQAARRGARAGGHDRDADLMEGFFAAAHASLERVAGSVPVDAFGEAAGILADADTIYLIARRSAFTVCGSMACAFGTLGVRSQLVGAQMGLDSESLAFAGRGDAAFVVSFAPDNADTLAQARALAGRGVPLVAMTESASSPLAEISRSCLEVSEQEFCGFRLLSAAMALAMALTVAVADRRRR